MGKLADELSERSKRDDEMIVGSEIRAALQELCDEAQRWHERHLTASAEVTNLRELASMVWVNSTINSPQGTDYRVPSDHLLALRDYVRDPASGRRKPITHDAECCCDECDEKGQ